MDDKVLEREITKNLQVRKDIVELQALHKMMLVAPVLGYGSLILRRQLPGETDWCAVKAKALISVGRLA